MKFKIFRAETVFWVLWKPKWWSRYQLCPELSTLIRQSSDEEEHFYSSCLDHPSIYVRLNLPTEWANVKPGYFIRGQDNNPRRIVTLFTTMEDTIAAISEVTNLYQKVATSKVCCIKTKPGGLLQAV